MISEDFEPHTGEDEFLLLEAVNDDEHLFVIYQVISFDLIEEPGVETGRTYSFIIFTLAIVTSNHVVTSIRHKEYWVEVIIVNGSAYGYVLNKVFNVIKGLLLGFTSNKLDMFLHKVGQCGGVFSEDGYELSNIIDEIMERLDFI
jgi:hypothetical protein